MQRLWRPRAVARVAIPLLIVLILSQVDRTFVSTLHAPWRQPAQYGLLLVDVLLAAFAVRAFTQALGGVLTTYLGLARARTASSVVSIVLYVIVALAVLQSARLDLSGFLVGGALTGVIIGIAGQASLSNMIAGLIILFARPFTAGMYLTARTGAFGGVEYSGQVWDISLFYTTLHSGNQEIRIPNSAMLASVVVVRPQELEVYIPLTLPLDVDLPAAMDQLRHAIESCTAARRTPIVVLERLTEVGFVTSVRVFVAGEPERRAVEQAIASVVHRQRPDELVSSAVDPEMGSAGDSPSARNSPSAASRTA